jgi:alpha-tubulin suppressor-like RCC1 family protein
VPGDFCEDNTCHLGATSVSTGQFFTCALLVDGSVRCWGSNEFGQLGTAGPTPPSGTTSVPVAVAGLGGAVQSLSSKDGNHTCAVLANGSVQCWGSDFEGELGPNAAAQTAEISATPVTVTGLPGSADAITSCESEFSCALMASNGAIWCWGSNIWGELGTATGMGNTPPLAPVQVTGITGATAISSGEDYNCAIVSGSAMCWGDVPQTGVSYIPMGVIGVGAGAETVLAIAPGEQHACAIVSGGTVECWGSNGSGQLGSTAVAVGNSSTSAVTVQGLPTGAKSMTAGGYHSCAILTNGSIWCWGLEAEGQLGNGATMQPNGDSFTVAPVQVTGLPTGLKGTAISAAIYQTCAVLSNGSVWCWGQGNMGQLGNGSSNSSIPIQVVGW